MSKRRRFRFSKCQHLGQGAECHRCEQAVKLEDLANKVEKYFDAVAATKSGAKPTEPSWLYMTSGEYRIHGITRTFVQKSSQGPDLVGKQFAFLMREEADRLRKPQQTKQQDRMKSSAVQGSLADQIA